MGLKAYIYKSGRAIVCKKSIQMIKAGENKLIYINI